MPSLSVRAVSAFNLFAPTAFSFVDQTNVGLSSPITSAPVTVSGLPTGSSANIAVSGGQYSINGGASTSNPGTVVNGDQVRAILTSSDSNSTAANCIVTIGGVADTFTATTAASSSSGDPVILYTDIVNGPTSGGENDNGAYLSIFGVNFGDDADLGAAGGSRVYINDVEVAAYFSIGTCRPRPDIERITVQVGALGGLTVGQAYTLKVVTNGVTSNTDHTFKRTSGRMIYAIASGTNGSGTFASPYTLSGYVSAGVQAGDHCVLRGGSYNAIYGSQYGSFQFSFAKAWGGGANAHTTWMGYPGESPVFTSVGAGSLGSGSGCFRLMNDAEDAGDGLAFANIEFRPDVSAIDHGGRGSTTYLAENGTGFGRCQGASNVRVVNVDCIPTYANIHASAHFVVSGSNCTYMGWGARDATAVTVSNLNHTMYISCGADNIDIGYYRISNIQGGHMIQVHTDYADDSAGYLFENFRVHHGMIRHDNPDNCRALNTGITHPSTANATWGAAETSYGIFHDNVFINVGQSFGVMVINSGNVRCWNNTGYNIKSAYLNYTTNLQGSFHAYLNARNNIYHGVTSSAVAIAALNGANSANLSASNNCYRGTVASYGGDANAVTGDPLFVNAGAEDLRLSSGSSCEDAGTDTSSMVTRDYAHVARPQGVMDIGAYELEAA